LLGRATERSGLGCVASTACGSAANGCCGCCAARDCWLPSGSVVAGDHGRTTARSSPRPQPALGHRRHHGLDSLGRVGVGLRGCGSLPRRGVGARGQDRGSVRCPAAGRRRRHRPLGPARRGRGPWAVATPRLGPQYRSAHFLGSIGWLGISDDAAFLGEPETNGCAERWIRTLKEQCLWAELHDTVDQLRQAVAGFVDRYTTSWLIQRHGHRTPRRRIRQLERQQRHDQVDTTSVQETGRCSHLTTLDLTLAHRHRRRSLWVEVLHVDRREAEPVAHFDRGASIRRQRARRAADKYPDRTVQVRHHDRILRSSYRGDLLRRLAQKISRCPPAGRPGSTARTSARSRHPCTSTPVTRSSVSASRGPWRTPTPRPTRARNGHTRPPTAGPDRTRSDTTRPLTFIRAGQGPCCAGGGW